MTGRDPRAEAWAARASAEWGVSREGLPAFAVQDVAPAFACTPRHPQALAECLAAAAETGTAMVPTGRGARLHVGREPGRYDVALSTRALAGVVAYEPADMTLTVGAGTTLDEIDAVLAEKGQWLPVDPAFPARTTIGGLIAADACGPLRLSQGKTRDLLIGIHAVLSGGRQVRGGGRVVKNVAGYDLMKLFTGSWGTLGVITEATFKVRPRPERVELVVLEAGSARAAAELAGQLVAAPVTPLCLELVNAVACPVLGLPAAKDLVVVGLGGTAKEVEEQRARVHRAAEGHTSSHLEGRPAGELLCALRDWPLRTRDEALWGATLAVLPSRLPELLAQLEKYVVGDEAAIVAHAGTASLCLRVLSSGERVAESPTLGALQRVVGRVGGFCVVDLLPQALRRSIDPWGEEPPGLGLMRRLKAALDPAGVLSPGRFVGGI